MFSGRWREAQQSTVQLNIVDPNITAEGMGMCLYGTGMCPCGGKLYCLALNSITIHFLSICYKDLIHDFPQCFPCVSSIVYYCCFSDSPSPSLSLALDLAFSSLYRDTIHLDPSVIQSTVAVSSMLQLVNTCHTSQLHHTLL